MRELESSLAKLQRELGEESARWESAAAVAKAERDEELALVDARVRKVTCMGRTTRGEGVCACVA